MSSSPRVLLVEFMTVDRLHCAMDFPFAAGLLRHRGLAYRWLRFAVRAAVQLERSEDGVGLADEEQARLRDTLREGGFTHVVFGHHPADSLREALDDPTVGMAVLGSAAGLARVAGARPLTHLEGLEALQSWLGLDDPLTFDFIAPALPLAFAPRYDWEPGNEQAATMAPFVFVFGGQECSYERALDRNHFFAPLVARGELPPRFGCTFCRRGTASAHPRDAMAPVDWVLQQLHAIATSHPRPGQGRLAIRLVGERTLAAIRELASAIAALSLPPADFLVDSRADTLVRLAPRLGEAAERLGAAGHRLELCLLGVENFSAPELERFHKGFGPETALAAVRALHALESAHPRAFGFRRFGGLSTILYSPWSTLEDVALNLAVVREFAIEEVCGKVLRSRLRLYEDLPLTALARAEGLLAPDYDDPALDTARRNFYEPEIPWRFRDARLLRFNRLATRLQDDPSLAGDPLYQRVQGWRREQTGSDIALAEALLRAIATHPDEEDLDAILALALHERRRPEDLSAEPEGVLGSARSPAGEQPPGGECDAVDDLATFTAGLKPALRLEPIAPSALAATEKAVRQARPGAVVRSRRRDWEGHESYELIGAQSEAVAEELMGLLDAHDAGIEDPALDRRHVQRIGELLGYAPCCARSFAEAPFVAWRNNEWLHLRNRIAEPGPVPAALRPFRGAVSYVLCSATCPEAWKQAEALKGPLDPDAPAWPILFLLDRPAHFVELAPEGPVGERFRYRFARRFGDDPRLALVERGDEIEVVPGQIRVLSRGEVLTCFSLDAYLWWHERAFHPEFWRVVLDQKLDPPAPPPRSRPPIDELPAAEKQPERARPLRKRSTVGAPADPAVVLDLIRQRLVRSGLPCDSVTPGEAGELTLRFTFPRGEMGFLWLARPSAPGEPRLFDRAVAPLEGTQPESLRPLLARVARSLEGPWRRGLGAEYLVR